MKILILGGSGFIGSHVAEALSKYNHSVVIYDLKKPEYLKKKYKFVNGSINNYKKLDKAIKGSDIIFNFAALADIDIARYEPELTAKVNILGSLNVLNLCKIHKVKVVIHASSIYADSHEGSFYAISKRAVEDYVQEFKIIYDLDYIILRFGSLYGYRADGNNGIQRIVDNLNKKNKIIYRGSKKAQRKYINVVDAAEVCAKILDKKYYNKCLNITGKKIIKIDKVLNFLSKKYNINRITYLNEKNTSHYNKKPTPYKIRKSEKLIIKKEKKFYESLINLVNINL